MSAVVASPGGASLVAEGDLGRVVVHARELVDVGGCVGPQHVEAQAALRRAIGHLI